MSTPQSELLAPALSVLQAAAPSSVEIGRLYDAVEQAVEFDADDYVPPTHKGRPTNEPSWRRNLRNALQQAKSKGRLANVAEGRWSVPRPDPTRHVDPDLAWGLVLSEARRRTGEVFESRSQGHRYRVAGTTPSRVEVERVDGSKPASLSPGEVRRAVMALNAAGGRTGLRTLNYTVAKETALVHLHPALSWHGGEIAARPVGGSGPQPVTATEVLARLTRAELLAAIEALDAGAETAFSDSTTYDVVHEGRSYPPLRVVAVAAEPVLGRPLHPHSATGAPGLSIKGGEGTPAFRTLERCGFDVVLKGPAADDTHPDEGVPVGSRAEGRRTRVWVNRYERDPKLRDACLHHHGAVCRVCEVDMAATYGELGVGFVHVHHVRPLAEGEERVTDPELDLIPVCPNCHAMLHRGRPPDEPRSVGELRGLVRRR